MAYKSLDLGDWGANAKAPSAQGEGEVLDVRPGAEYAAAAGVAMPDPAAGAASPPGHCKAAPEVFPPEVFPPATWDGFRTFIWRFWELYGRKLFWREEPDPYRVVISEVMLQQTQVARVEERLPRFLARFPGFAQLAAAPVSELMLEWSGLGYNRRALNLQRAAAIISTQYGGQLPESVEELKKLPGFGPYTAAAVYVFAFGRPALVFETNIRRVFLHHFTEPGSAALPDSKLKELVLAAMDSTNPRHWYYALMDYGSRLASLLPNPNRRSSSYVKQSRFEGSQRQERGAVLRVLSASGRGLVAEELRQAVQADLGRPLKWPLLPLVEKLLQEGFLVAESVTESVTETTEGSGPRYGLAGGGKR